MTACTYEFHLYSDPPGAEAESVRKVSCVDDRDAQKHAREIALGQDGPVDVARVGPEAWNDRYIATARRDLTSGRVLLERLD